LLQDAFQELKNKHFANGLISEDNVENNPHLFLANQLFLAQRLGTLRASEEIPFQIIPQLKMNQAADFELITPFACIERMRHW
jgi:hypothetical protein